MGDSANNQELQKFRHEYINRRWSQLHALEKESAERAIKYLLLTNSGGAVAVLSFMGSSEKARASLCVWFALLLFGIGVILVGIYNAWFYHRVSGLFESWKKDANNFYAGKVNWDFLTEEDDKRSAPSKFGYIIGYSSFIAFIAGCVLGIISLFK